jgi:hypothetical protein
MKGAPRSPSARPARGQRNEHQCGWAVPRPRTSFIFIGSWGVALPPAASTYSVPDPPYNLFRSFFLVHMRLGVTWFFILEARVPQALLGMEHDLEVAVAEGCAPAR